eukprot:CAMPEP_0197078756 /NCGR_PEP_ID=MMETSP1384-20130603/213281_1 /TAXON_ID=29189 /ORGANISM="Ammonia sp." /LENGTH=625 /DNA_ID=CAMNT_0042517625 /DNA_START=22 /DNA_END=1899 /DNA_ORIENTATION=+
MSSTRRKNNAQYEPAAIIPMSSRIHHEDDGDELGHAQHSHHKRSAGKKKKKRSSKKSSYVRISTSFDDIDDNDTDEDEDTTDEADEQETQAPSPQIGGGHQDGATMPLPDTQNLLQTNGATSSTTRNLSAEDELEDVQLNSPNHALVDVDINRTHEDEDDSDFDAESAGNAHGMNNMNGILSNRETTNNGKTRYGLSAYYGVRLNYAHSKCHDVTWAVLWILHCLIILVVLVVVWSSRHVHMPHASNGLFLMSFLLAFAIIYSFIWTFLLKYCGGFIVWVLILGNLIFLAAFSSFCYMVQDKFLGLGIVFTILFALFALFTLLIRKRITYTISLLQLGSSILVTTPSALAVSFGVLIFQIAWIFLWGSIVVAWTAQFYHTNSSSDFGGILLVLTLSFFWTHSVIKNIGHTTICAVIAHWYFSPKTPYPTCAALFRCLTTSLGSIAFGSLFGDILQGIRAYLRVLRDEGPGCCSCCKLCLTCCLTACDGLLEYFNAYAYCHIAVYNTAYLKSGKNTFDLLSISRIYQLMNSNYTEYALLCGCICGGIMNAIMGAYVSNIMQFSTDWVVLFTCGGFLIGMALSSTLLNAVSSCITALFVLVAEEPNLLKELHPEQALRFDAAKKGVA